MDNENPDTTPTAAAVLAAAVAVDPDPAAAADEAVVVGDNREVSRWPLPIQFLFKRVQRSESRAICIH